MTISDRNFIPGTEFVTYDPIMTRLPHLMAILAVAGAIVATSRAEVADAPQSEREKRENLMEQQKAHRRIALKNLEPLPQSRMSQVLQFRVERRQLVVNTPLHAPLPNMRADIAGLGMPAELSYTQLTPNDPDSSQLEFTLLDYPDKLTNVRIHLTCQPNTDGSADLSLESSLQTGPTGEHFARVVYTQTATRAQLQAFGTAVTEDQDSQTVMLLEKDFATLREKHPAAMETWLRPVLHRLQQDFVFATDSNAAWQALAEEWPISPVVASKVENLLPDLNSRNWQTRHTAEKNLARLGRDGATVIMRHSRSGLSLEQNARLDELLSHFQPLSADQVRKLSVSPEFLLDCEYCDDATVRRLAAARLAKILGHPLSFNVDLPDAQRGEAIEQIRAQLVTARPAAADPH
jgi:hypothetical protein